MKRNSQLKKVQRNLQKLLASCLLLLSFLAQGQDNRKITGTVTNAAGMPVAGATISIKKSKIAVVSDASGKFSIDAPKNATLVVSYTGMDSREVQTGNSNTLTILMESKADPLDDVVVLAYGSQRKKDLTGSVSVVKLEDAKKTATYDIAKMLQGQAAGVTVQGSGEPGGFVQIKIRGISTFGNNSPLFVIDGVPLDAPYDFSPNDIESMQVLKDASSAALYGSRAAQGVIIITTKKGKAGQMKVGYNGYYGGQKIAQRMSLTDRVGYQKITNAAEVNAGLGIAPGNDPTNPAFISNVNTDWQEELYKTGNIQDHSVSMSGGTEAATFNVGLGYFNQTGTLKGPQEYNRYTFNSNLQGKIGRFAYGAKVAYTQSDKQNFGTTYGHAIFGGALTSMLTAIPTMPVYDANRLGGYGGSDNVKQRAITLNVIGLGNLVTDNNDRNRFLGNVWGEFEIIKNLKYKLNVSYDRTDYKNFHYEPKYDLGFYYLNTVYYMNQRNGIDNTSQIENTLSYKWEKGKHKLEVLAGTSYLARNYEDITATASGTQDLQFLTFSSITNPADKAAFSYKSTNTLLSYLGRANYNYGDRYLLTANYRRDGSSRFGPANKYGDFSSVAAAWNVSSEKFIRLPKQISSLKLRGGYGEVGNQNFGDYLFQSYINANASYVFGNTLAPGATTVSQVDPAIKWEATATLNIAADLGLFNNRLLVSAEYYKRKSTDLLANIPLPLSVGSVPSSIFTNAASTENTGMEFTVSYGDKAGAFRYNVSGNLTTLKNKVIKLGGTNNPIYGTGSKTEVGRSVGELFGFITEGLFNTNADVAAHATQTGAKPGDVRFKDVNGTGADGKLTGKPDGKITDDDRVYLGTTIPKLSYGFNFDCSYKNFDASFFLQGNAGNKVFNGVYHDLMIGQYSNHHTDQLNYWTPTNTNTNVPRPVIYDPNGNGRFSDRFVESGSYVKLQNAQIGYTLPSTIFKGKVFKSFRAYVSGQNLVIFSKYRGYDPDFISDGLFSRGFDLGSFPNPRSVLVGVQVGF
ncbi:MAG: TonB-dependent receptor [Bacteroidota bacterium]